MNQKEDLFDGLAFDGPKKKTNGTNNFIGQSNEKPRAQTEVWDSLIDLGNLGNKPKKEIPTTKSGTTAFDGLAW